MTTLRQVSDGVADALERAGSWIVEVRGRKRPSSGIVLSADRVVTAAHTLHREENLVVVLPSGEERAAGLMGQDPSTDLALLSVTGGGLTPATWADPATARMGALVFPLARRGKRVRAAFGVVAEVGPAWQTVGGTEVSAWVDVDGSLPPGFSGGPLIDADGNVVGLNTSALTPRGAVLPFATIDAITKRLEQHGTTAPGYVGAGFYPGTLPEELATAVGQSGALMAVSIDPKGPAIGAGLLVGDALIRVDGTALTGVRHLLLLLAAKGAGATVSLTVVRAGSTVDVPLTLGQRRR